MDGREGMHLDPSPILPHGNTSPESSPIKRKRGRPRKYALDEPDTELGAASSSATAMKRKRGRPRKHASEESVMEAGAASISASTMRRKRGRPPDTGLKQRPANVGDRPAAEVLKMAKTREERYELRTKVAYTAAEENEADKTNKTTQDTSNIEISKLKQEMIDLENLLNDSQEGRTPCKL